MSAIDAYEGYNIRTGNPRPEANVVVKLIFCKVPPSPTATGMYTLLPIYRPVQTYSAQHMAIQWLLALEF